MKHTILGAAYAGVLSAVSGTVQAVLITPTVDLSYVNFTGSLNADANGDSPAAPFYESYSTSEPSLEDINIVRTNATTPAYIAMDNYYGPHGANSHAESSGHVNLIGGPVYGTSVVHIYGDISGSISGNAHNAEYDCTAVYGFPASCTDYTMTTSSIWIDYRLDFTLTEDHSFSFYADGSNSSFTFSHAFGVVEWDSSGSEVLSGILPAGYYSIHASISHSATAVPPIEGYSWNGNVYYDLQMAPTAVPIPAAAWLLGSGLIGLISVARKEASLVPSDANSPDRKITEPLKGGFDLYVANFSVIDICRMQTAKRDLAH